MFSTSQTNQVNLFSLNIDDDFEAALSRTACHDLHTLHLIHASISLKSLNPLGAHRLMTGLILHGRLHTLDLSNTPSFGDAGCAHLARLLADCPTLKELSLRGDRIGPDGADALAQAIAPAARPTSPADQNLSQSPRARLSTPPARRSRLESLDLRRNVVGDAGAAALAAALARGAPLRELDVSGNWVTGRGAEALAAALRGNRRLRRLTVRAIATDGQERRLGRLREEEARGPAVSM
jgi:Ran GTPase-activating protein (RanGAP) involved in mRNA processing and transport